MKKKESVKADDITGKLDKFIKKLNTIENDNDIITPTTSERSSSNQSSTENDKNGELNNNINTLTSLDVNTNTIDTSNNDVDIRV